MSEQKNKLYVGNLEYSIGEDELGSFVSEKGVTTTSVTVIKDKYTNRSKGFGFIELENEGDVEKAIELLNGQDLKGRKLNVSQAREKEQRPMGGGFSRGPRGGGDRDSRGPRNNFRRDR
jgi:RNA recognition motif-containing protein